MNTIPVALSLLKLLPSIAKKYGLKDKDIFWLSVGSLFAEAGGFRAEYVREATVRLRALKKGDDVLVKKKYLEYGTKTGIYKITPAGTSILAHINKDVIKDMQTNSTTLQKAIRANASFSQGV